MDSFGERAAGTAEDVAPDMAHGAAERAKFREMKQGTAEDWAIIGNHFREFAPGGITLGGGIGYQPSYQTTGRVEALRRPLVRGEHQQHRIVGLQDVA